MIPKPQPRRTEHLRVRQPRRWSALRRRVHKSARNALDLARLGQLSERRGTPYEVVWQCDHARLRRYGEAPVDAAVLLLIPPLMVTAEIYDVAPERSAVQLLCDAEIDTFVVDFGAPENELGGLRRTLDDHVRAVVQAIEAVVNRTGRKVHLAGYSQGGMFVYQAAAMVSGDQLQSLITFGSPVDIHRSIPAIHSAVLARAVAAIHPVLEVPLARIQGLPGRLTSLGFKVLAWKRELPAAVDFLQKLHDRDALARREGQRRFLAGEGFVAWPGPALRQFINEFVIHNRMLSGGFVIDGRPHTLSSIRAPILCVLGRRDDIARAPAVRAIHRAAPKAEVHELAIYAGHFGLVVGSQANAHTWPNVIDWIRWREHGGARPSGLPPAGPRPSGRAPHRPADDTRERDDVESPLETVAASVPTLVRRSWKQAGSFARDWGSAFDHFRYHLPRLRSLRRLSDDDLLGVGDSLAAQFARDPHATFLLWNGRAFTRAEAHERVNDLCRALLSLGLSPSDRVGVWMRGRPSYLTAIAALTRIGAVPVIASPGLDAKSIGECLAAHGAEWVVCDAVHAQLAAATGAKVIITGGGPRPVLDSCMVDIETLSAQRLREDLPSVPKRTAPRASEPMVFLLTRSDGDPHLGRTIEISHHRWALSAHGAAAACTLTPRDTVYCCLAIHHPAGLLSAVGAALVSGARLALAPGFSSERFWPDIRLTGATVAFYAGDLGQRILRAKTETHAHPLRILAGSGMRTSVWNRIRKQLGVDVVEFYASTQASLVLAQPSARKIGALGKPLPGSAAAAVLSFDFHTQRFRRTSSGQVVPARAGESGILIGKLSERSSRSSTESHRQLQDVFQSGDRWFVTDDVVSVDAEGDFFYVDRLRDMISLPSRPPIASRAIEDAVLASGALTGACAYQTGGKLVLCLETDSSEIDVAALQALLAAAALPPVDYVRTIVTMPRTEGFRPLKEQLRAEGITSTCIALAGLDPPD